MRQDLEILSLAIEKLLEKINNMDIPKLDEKELQKCHDDITIVETKIGTFKSKTDGDLHFQGTKAQRNWDKIEEIKKAIEIRLETIKREQNKTSDTRHEDREVRNIEINEEAINIAKNSMNWSKWAVGISVLAIVVSILK